MILIFIFCNELSKSMSFVLVTACWQSPLMWEAAVDHTGMSGTTKPLWIGMSLSVWSANSTCDWVQESVQHIPVLLYQTDAQTTHTPFHHKRLNPGLLLQPCWDLYKLQYVSGSSEVLNQPCRCMPEHACSMLAQPPLEHNLKVYTIHLAYHTTHNSSKSKKQDP